MILGGVEIPYHLGLLGHSDADVLCHAISDAILGAIGGRDIGFHFPDKDPKYEGISSILLLQKVGELAFEKGAEISNIDATIVLQEPHVSKYITTMEENVARALNIKVEDVNIKATTEEKLGFTGNGDGID
ncbi:MAG: 2-C-methyl-D-erythritol 2,4-cyclodiphosphate synthase [Clostridia bacterium]|nr:2-C-methyl-D-erythritol 2,4-cyclodiphosphate synthase [Clostridia bacterium]